MSTCQTMHLSTSAFAGLVDDYDKASSTASLADNPRFDSEFEVDDGAAPDDHRARVTDSVDDTDTFGAHLSANRP